MTVDIDAALVRKHYCLNDPELLDLLPVAKQKGIGIVNGFVICFWPSAERNTSAWHPASPEEQNWNKFLIANGATR
jgi:L-galactose dehydrogenase